MVHPLFIALEGIDGSGKSTQAKLLAAELEKEGHKVHLTFEPTDGPIGLLLRKIFRHELEADHRTIAALFAADRLEHLLDKKKGILKMRKDGYTVISDRYYFSSYAYHGTHMAIDWVISINEQAAHLLRPDLTIYIDVSPELSLQRIAAGRNTVELYETSENLAKVRSKYMEAFAKLRDIETVSIVGGNGSQSEIAAAIRDEVRKIASPQNSLR